MKNRATVASLTQVQSAAGDGNCARRRPSAAMNLALDLDDDDNDAVANDQLDIVVAHIRRLARTASLEFALRVGGVIIHHFYGGDPDAWRSRGPKTASFRRLSEHPELPMSPGALYRCVALYELCIRLNAPSRWEQLGASHLRLVLGLSPDVQERLLSTANAKRWTVRVLQQHVLLERSASLSRGGRKAHSRITRMLRTSSRCLEGYEDVSELAGQLSPQELKRSILLAEEARTRLEYLLQALRAALATGNVAAGPKVPQQRRSAGAPPTSSRASDRARST